MVVIADITVPASAFELGRVLDEFPEIRVELERIVPLHDSILPLFWISGGDNEKIKATLREDSQVQDVTELTTADEQTLFEVAWSPNIDGIIQALIDSEAKILEATGTADEWEFRLRFSTHDDLSRFNMALTEENIPVTLHHMYNPTIPRENSPISTEQGEAIRTAFEGGYFEVPRGSTVAELATEMGISDSAFSQRLRRGLSTVVGERLFADENPTQRG